MRAPITYSTPAENVEFLGASQHGFAPSFGSRTVAVMVGTVVGPGRNRRSSARIQGKGGATSSQMELWK